VIVEKIEVRRRRGRRGKHLLVELREKRRQLTLKEEAINRTVRRKNCF
jgi:hypothetical protein